MDAASLRILMRDQFCNDLAPFLEESLRGILREELMRHTGISLGDGKIHNEHGTTLNGSLREAAAGSNPGAGLPGSTVPPTPPDMAWPNSPTASGATAEEGEERECEYTSCGCGNTLMDDAVFCRKCGERRPEGLKGDDQKAKMLRSGSTMSRSALKSSKPQKQSMKLFKQNEPEPIGTALQQFTHNKYYEACSATLIILNSMCLGTQTQHMAVTMADQASRGEQLEDLPVVFDVLGYMFCFVFTVELGLRWKAEGLFDFFKSEDMWWNVLDIAVVGGSILELLMDFIAFASDSEKSDFLSNVSVLRVLRVVRVVRVARVIRVMRFFRELRMMIYSILGCLKNLLWVFVILIMTFYVFGVGFTSAIIEYLDKAEKWLHEDNQVLIKSFGTLDRSLLSLFMSMSGGNDWSQYYECLSLLPLGYRLAYLVFILFCLFAVVNIVTGIFVESALQSNLTDRDIIVHEELQVKKKYLQSMEQIFEEMDEDGKGTISMQEFEDKLQDERVVAYFNALKLDVSDAQMLFQLLDADQSNEINIDEFLEGCVKLQGESRSLDMRIMQWEVRFLKERFNEIGALIREVIKSVPPKDAPKGARTPMAVGGDPA